MKKILRLMVFALIGILSIGALVACNTGKTDEPKEDYSKLTFAEVFEIQDWDKPGNAGMPGMTMAQLTGSSSSSAYLAQETHAFYLKTKYDVEITGVSFSMQPEKEVHFLDFRVSPATAIGSEIFKTTADPITTGSNAFSKTYSFTHTLKKGNSLYVNAVVAEDEAGNYFINATLYNFKLNFIVVQK